MGNKRLDGSPSNHAIGDRHGKWNGGRTIDKDGYILVRIGKRYKREHRVIAEMLIGRMLGSREAVHHIDGNITNNIPENLEVTTWSRHRKHHDREMGRDKYGRFPNPNADIKPIRDKATGRFLAGKIANALIATKDGIR